MCKKLGQVEEFSYLQTWFFVINVNVSDETHVLVSFVFFLNGAIPDFLCV